MCALGDKKVTEESTLENVYILFTQRLLHIPFFFLY
jgi:hypothetical protein